MRGLSLIGLLVSILITGFLILAFSNAHASYRRYTLEFEATLRAETEIERVLGELRKHLDRRILATNLAIVGVQPVTAVPSPPGVFTNAIDTLCVAPCSDLDIYQSNECDPIHTHNRAIRYKTACFPGAEFNTENATCPLGEAPVAHVLNIPAAEDNPTLALSDTPLFTDSTVASSLCFRVCMDQVVVEASNFYRISNKRLKTAYRRLVFPLNTRSSNVQVVSPICP